MPIGVWSVFQGYVTPARLPSIQTLTRVGAWGGVVVVGGLYMVQPWDWLAVQAGLKKEEK
ncbi:hypothetical protein CHLRE_09g409150v5 [Chlamydomonas reinhardtii]|uniref:Mitochondrial ubiquinol-cytochrome c oxidoreductase subunit 10 n=1 Tax=Chlamydomonas reinhardtii TaxID=3055 RepID=A8J4K5_CHLRE|nr:uncharacterized protein CHLRE_09g409150v5 [Chlamydomonas reinhardtii]PNW79283.1 hypothetical protein CHLRE_09g409150v5 [Chlamydomonas reinhardtii]DAA79965.1 TPA_inf: mitochondrial ubiquinol-cytochrome c oxidoreductase subunit 10 precursor [Chlamydomonas reinhardtii]|eukprot:XP_001696682.1 ubiquinol:cytochrome c oxidoreductase 10 kDa subunit [Chlamydomonas reinhardtii]